MTRFRDATGAVRAILWTALLLLPMAGCGGSDRAYVSGTVQRRDGSPLPDATVIARSNDTGDSGKALTDNQGRFELSASGENGDGIPAGDYYVVIQEYRGDPDQLQPATISNKYTKRTLSGIEFSVAAGEKKVLDVTLDPP